MRVMGFGGGGKGHRILGGRVRVIGCQGKSDGHGIYVQEEVEQE